MKPVSASVGAPPPLIVMSAPVLIATIIFVCTAFSSQMVMPLWIGAVMDDYALPAEAAGRIASIEFIIVAAVSLILAARVDRVNIRLVSLIGIICLMLGNGGAVIATDVDALTGLRALCGLGKGLIVAGIFSLVARTVNPTKSFAVLNASYAAFSAGFYLIVPHFIERQGASGAFLIMFVITVVGGLFLYWVPSGRIGRATTKEAASQSPIRIEGILVLLALVVMWSGNSAIWTFVERIGVRSGLDVTEIGAVLSLSAVLTILGPSLAHILHVRFGFKKPVDIALILQIAVAVILCNVINTTVFVGTAPFLNLLALFVVPYLMGLMSAADPKGRLAAAAAAAMTAGGSLGAYVGGVTLTHTGYGMLSAVAILFFLVVMVLIHVAAKRIPVAKLELQPSGQDHRR